ncbi:MAG: hypothetical protein ACYS22_18260 [Planctomycetota bacterium]
MTIARSKRTLPNARVVASVHPEDQTPRQVLRRFRGLLNAGAELRPAGRARHEPKALSAPRYLPRQEIRLFDATFFLTDQLYDDALGYLIAYVMPEPAKAGGPLIYPRIFYKDSSLVWRVASHFVHDHEEYWIGKGDVRWERRADGEYLCTAEETTNLPYEMQNAVDQVSRRKPKRRDDRAVQWVLREAPSNRLEPYADFTAPRRRAAALHRINRGRRVAYFARPGDPGSLRFVKGYEPDFADGVLEEFASWSTFFGGELRKFRILSTNRKIQYLFMSSPTHAWINPPQALTTELSSYGVRTHDVLADDDAFIPGYEYHEHDGDDPANGHSQIPARFAGEPHPLDPARADASAWIEALPVIQEFRARVLGEV